MTTIIAAVAVSMLTLIAVGFTQRAQGLVRLGYHHTVRAALMEGTLWTLAVGGLLFATLLLDWRELAFARRWGGGCGGWTNGLAMFHLCGMLAHWWAYTTAAFVILRLHPILEGVPEARIAVYLMVAFIFGCGVTHLLDAYTMFNPVYRQTGVFLFLNSIVSVLGAIFIAKALVRTFAVVAMKRKRAERLEELHAARKGVL